MTFGFCPACGNKQRITHTRYTETSAIRRKKCKACGARYVTYETYSEAEWIKQKAQLLAVPSAAHEMNPTDEYSAELEIEYNKAAERWRDKGVLPSKVVDDTTPPELDDLMRQLLAKPKT